MGGSKIGGIPDLPSDFEWPYHNNQPMAFCAQYNCAELHSHDVKKELPSTGIFYVFIHIDRKYPGFLNDENSYKFLYIEQVDSLKKFEPPKGYLLEEIFRSAKVEFFEFFTIPHYQNYKLIDLSRNPNFYILNEETNDFIDKICGNYADNLHQFLGEDRSVQSSVVYNFAEKELQVESLDDYNTKKEEIFTNAKDYKILLQIDCNDKNTDLTKYGGSMVIYFGLKKEDLVSGNFDNTVMAFQGT